MNEAKPTCQYPLWIHGESRKCGQSVGVTFWTDHTGITHHACPRHLSSMQRRWPASLPEVTAEPHGTLGLSSPWARGAFGPGDRIDIENDIPPGYIVGVSGHRTNALVWVIDPEGYELTRWVGQRDAVWAARQAVRFIRERAA